MKNILFVMSAAAGLMISSQSFGDREVIWNLYTDSSWYFTPKAQPEQKDFYTRFGSFFAAESEYEYLFYDLSSKVQISTDKSYSLVVHSAYAGFQVTDIPSVNFLKSILVFVGRYNKQWSWMDEYWHLGVWNPRNLFDPLHPESLGITGSAIVFKGSHWSFTNMVGGLYFPDQTPSLSNNETGRLQTTSRWVSPPTSNIFIFNKNLNAYYWIEQPYLKNVLFQTSYLSHFFIGSPDTKWLSLSYAYKPLNQLFYRIESGLSISDSAVKNYIKHHTMRHRLISAELGFQKHGWKGNLGALDESLEAVDLPENQLTPVVPSAFFTSASLSKDFHLGSLNNNLRVSYLYSWFRSYNNQSLIGGESLVSLERFKIGEGLAVDLLSEFQIQKAKKITAFIRYWYSRDQNGSWLEGALSYHFKPRSWVRLELNILGAQTTYRTGFFSKYGHNDRLTLRVQYGI